MKLIAFAKGLAILTSFILLVFGTSNIFAEDEHDHDGVAYKFQGVGESQTDLQKKLEENRKEQEKLRGLLSETQSKKVTLQSEITYQDNQIKLTQLKIEETENEIEKLTGQINNLEGVLANLSDVFAQRAAETYKLKRTGDSLIALLTSPSVSEFIQRFEYLQRIQENDRDLLLEMQSTQTSYEDQRAKVEALHDKLQSQNDLLTRQKVQKQRLLDLTKNDEKRYQEMLASLRADEQAIEKAISSLIARIVAGIATGTQVSKGQIIGQEGNTGYVFPKPSSSCPTCGYHLHYMVLPCNVLDKGTSCHTDPSGYLDNGQYVLPMDMSGGWRSYQTQGYGNTSFSQSGAYGGSGHSGVDLQVSPFGSAVKSIDSGTVYYGTDSAGAHYALVKHKDDFWTAYWHLQ